MSSVTRQSELFASKDWRIIYEAFTQINFNSSDPATINAALRQYIQNAYPEIFNDWIESDELIAIIDLLSWLAGVLAFKTDINARENFIETAAARESILRLARFLSYTPKRNQPATGFLKIIEVTTDDDIEDTTGQKLAGVKVIWNDPDDIDWFERFATVMSAAFVNSNPFGTPLKYVTSNNNSTQLYRFNAALGDQTLSFSTKVAGTSMDFETCNVDFDDNGVVSERVPDLNSAFHTLYRNDGNGFNSTDTGFFLYFKQGTTTRQTFRIDTPIENQVIDLPNAGVNDTDVWVQTVSDTGDVIVNWTKVPTVFAQNVTFNALPADQRYIYSVITRDNDMISARFSDGVFGNAPVGNIRFWTRSSNGQQYSLRPYDINRVTQTIKYYNTAGQQRNLKVTFSLQSTVANAAPRESDEDIRNRAPAMYSTQNRMVSGNDYNVFPLYSNQATKVKAVNRIYSGHSRHIDLNDPTENYQDVVVFSDDGILYKEKSSLYREVPTGMNLTAAELIDLHLQPMLASLDAKSYINDVLMTRILNNTSDAPVIPTATWTQSATAKYSSSGYFNTAAAYFRAGTSIKFSLPGGATKWATILSTQGDITRATVTGTRGAVTLNEAIPSNATVIKVLPGYQSDFSPLITTLLSEKFDNRLSFTLWFDPVSSNWIIDNANLLSQMSNPPSIAPTAIAMASVNYISGAIWQISINGARYVFESERKVQWYNSDDARVIDYETGLRKYDVVTVMKCNADARYTDGRGQGTDRLFNSMKTYYYSDGTPEPRCTIISLVDSDADGEPDDPESFTSLLRSDTPDSTLFWQLGTSFGQNSYLPIYNVYAYQNGLPNTGNSSMTAYDGATFYLWVNNAWVAQPSKNYKVATGRGNNVAVSWTDSSGTVSYPIADPLSFKWTHYAPLDYRIDPSITNIIDMFVLTTEYDYLIRQWIANGADISDIPVTPTELDLRLTFSTFDQYKMFSDQMVWRPVKYKFLFGPGSEDNNLRAQFKVVKLPGTTIADGEIKTRLIAAVNEYFSVGNWDFGDTFYFTELAAYIHQQLATVIGSVVLVPMGTDASFGDGFEITARSDELFISTAQVSDVVIIDSNTVSNLRIR